MKLILASILALFVAGYAQATTTISTNAFGHVVTTVDGVSTVAVPAGNAAPATYGPFVTAAVTNGQAVSLVADAINVLTMGGGANAATGTITLATTAAANVGKVVWVFNGASATNSLAVAQSGNYDGPAIVLAPGQGKAIFLQTTTSFLGQ